jgi:hypothetical protein
MSSTLDWRLGEPSPALAGVLGSTLYPASPIAEQGTPAERLLEAIESHLAEEVDSLAAYRRLAETGGDPLVALLMRLVIDDEERHHRLLQQMAARLHDGLSWSHSPDALPSGTPVAGAASSEAIAATLAFIREEHEGARELRRLARDEHRFADGLFSLLLETMATDSDKHERILRFILARFEAQSGGGG